MDQPAACSGGDTRTPEVTRRIFAISDFLKGTLYEFTRKFDIDLLIAENSLTIPMNIPLGVALTQFIAETGFPTIAHHHDFYWERDRFSVNAVGDVLAMAFPPSLPSIQHVTINSFAQQDLSPSLRSVVGTGAQRAELRGRSPGDPDEYASDFRHGHRLGAGRHHVPAADPRRAPQGHRTLDRPGRGD